jgi:HlyD family secretion protein
LTGTVSQIGLEVRRQAVLAADPVSNTDARIVKVRVALDKPSSERSRALSGLQVVGKIAAGRT